MAALELLVPPPVVALTVGAVMWGASSLVPSIDASAAVRMASAAAIAVAGLCFDLAGIVSFWRAKTTINPMKPTSSSSLVDSGVYRITRNPMYLGLLFILVAWAVFLASPWLLLGPLVFVLYLTRYQIIPEERALSAKFGGDYETYKARVRRWL